MIPRSWGEVPVIVATASRRRGGSSCRTPRRGRRRLCGQTITTRPIWRPASGPCCRRAGGGGDNRGPTSLRLKVGGLTVDPAGGPISMVNARPHRPGSSMSWPTWPPIQPGGQPEGAAAGGLATHRQRTHRGRPCRPVCAANSVTTVEAPRFPYVHRGVGIMEDAGTPRREPRLMYRRLIYFGLAVLPHRAHSALVVIGPGPRDIVQANQLSGGGGQRRERSPTSGQHGGSHGDDLIPIPVSDSPVR